MACTAASLPASCPAQSWRVPAASSTSSLMTERMALLMILLDVSPTPTGRISGHLSRAIKRLAVSGASPSGSTYVVHSFLATKAKLLHRSTGMRCRVVSNRWHRCLRGLQSHGCVEQQSGWLHHSSNQRLLGGFRVGW